MAPKSNMPGQSLWFFDDIWISDDQDDADFSPVPSMSSDRTSITIDSTQPCFMSSVPATYSRVPRSYTLYQGSHHTYDTSFSWERGHHPATNINNFNRGSAGLSFDCPVVVQPAQDIHLQQSESSLANSSAASNFDWVYDSSLRQQVWHNSATGHDSGALASSHAQHGVMLPLEKTLIREQVPRDCFAVPEPSDSRFSPIVAERFETETLLTNPIALSLSQEPCLGAIADYQNHESSRFEHTASWPQLPELESNLDVDLLGLEDAAKLYEVEWNCIKVEDNYPQPQNANGELSQVYSAVSSAHESAYASSPRVAATTALCRPVISRRPGRTTLRDKSRDDILIRCKSAGMSYKDIKRTYGFEEAESTLRGRFRTLIKPKEQRLRKPEWSAKDVDILKQAVDMYLLSQPNVASTQLAPSGLHGGKDAYCTLEKVPWKLIAEHMASQGCYRFGNGTVKKKYLEVMSLQSAASVKVEAGQPY